jgi:hypothetical protein
MLIRRCSAWAGSSGSGFELLPFWTTAQPEYEPVRYYHLSDYHAWMVEGWVEDQGYVRNKRGSALIGVLQLVPRHFVLSWVSKDAGASHIWCRRMMEGRLPCGPNRVACVFSAVIDLPGIGSGEDEVAIVWRIRKCIECRAMLGRL